MGSRAQFVCQSSSCGREAEIETSLGNGAGQVSNPQCTCGAKMKRVYSKPVLRELPKKTFPCA